MERSLSRRAVALQIVSVLVASGCGARSGLSLPPDARAPGPDAAIEFAGTYTNCAAGQFNSSGGGVLFNTSGIQSGAVLTVEQRGTALTATFVDQNHLSTAYEFALTGPSSAVLAPEGQVAAHFTTLCVPAVGWSNESLVPAQMELSAGALVYDAHAAFLSATGTVVDTDAGPCGVQTAPATLWLACQAADGGTPAPSPVDAGAPSIAAGEYACDSQVDTLGRVGGAEQYATGGAQGTLTLAQAGSALSARYASDQTVAGALRFVGTSATTAAIAAGQTMDAQCPVALSPGAPPARGTLSVTAGALMLDGATLVVSLFGTMTSGCTGTQTVATLACTRR